MQSFRADYPVTHRPTNTMIGHPYMENSYYKKRTLSGTVAIFVFLLAVILILVAFSTPYWLESDKRIVGSKFEKLGLWTHCFRSLPDPYDPAMGRFFSGCRWIFDPFTTGYQEIRSFLVPPFFVAVQFFFTMCFVTLLIAIVLVPAYILCYGPGHDYYVLLLRIIGIVLMISG
ncbi:hypothetical protein Ocin01_04467 [Orchesella cincta]|uniref:Transmembrane protein n=1 Tax=Orchesella cincta TaxID=48709 RepID=A0A1D2NB52_ORCCI|nr:hypothetical protein Ocin01_04467 [Orchesella cincta]